MAKIAILHYAVAVAQLVEMASLSTKIYGSCTTIGKIYFICEETHLPTV